MTSTGSDGNTRGMNLIPSIFTVRRGLLVALCLASFSLPARAAPSPKLLAPEKATARAPKVFKARFTTTKGDFTVEVHRDWAPLGADRFYNLVKSVTSMTSPSSAPSTASWSSLESTARAR